MRQKPALQAGSTEKVVKDIRRATRKQYSAEEKNRIVPDDLRGEYSTAELCWRERIAESLYCSWSKDFLEPGKRRLACDTERSASTGEVKALRHELRDMKELLAGAWARLNQRKHTQRLANCARHAEGERPRLRENCVLRFSGVPKPDASATASTDNLVRSKRSQARLRRRSASHS